MSVIIAFFTNIVDWVISILSAVWTWYVDLMESLFSGLLEGLFNTIPGFSTMWTYLDEVQPYTAFINQWVALDTASELLVAYFSYIATMIGVKLFIKLFIPTVG